MNKIKYVLFHKQIKIFGRGFSVFELFLISLGIYFFVFLEPKSLIDLTALIVAVILHEIAHGYVANQFGDPTAKQLGRLSLSPLPHIDPVGSVILPALLIFSGAGFIIGWAKPVPVNDRYFQNPLRDMMWVAIAGPLTNISIAIVCSFIYKLIIFFQVTELSWVLYFCYSSIVINIVLAIFNMVPIPPLDGSKVLTFLLPQDWRWSYAKLEPYGFVIIMILVFMGVFGKLLSFVLPPVIGVLL